MHVARGPLDLRARYRVMPADIALIATDPQADDAAVRDLAARVSYTLPDARVLSLESRHTAYAQGAQTSVLLGYSLARTRLVDVEGRIGYAAGAEMPTGPEAWMAGLSLRVALGTAGTMSPRCNGSAMLAADRCDAR